MTTRKFSMCGAREKRTHGERERARQGRRKRKNRPSLCRIRRRRDCTGHCRRNARLRSARALAPILKKQCSFRRHNSFIKNVEHQEATNQHTFLPRTNSDPARCSRSNRTFVWGKAQPFACSCSSRRPHRGRKGTQTRRTSLQTVRDPTCGEPGVVDFKP